MNIEIMFYHFIILKTAVKKFWTTQQYYLPIIKKISY